MKLLELEHWEAQQRLFSKPLPRLGSFAVVRDEERFLLEHLLYHRALGVCRVFLFLDRCSDKSHQIAASCPWVKIIEAPRDGRHASNISTHQVLCCGLALDLARQEGLDWLMHLDPDEFAYGEHACELSEQGCRSVVEGIISEVEVTGHLGAMLGDIDGHVDQLILPTKEVIPAAYELSEPFWQQEYFATNRAIERHILNPLSGRMEFVDRWIGHNRGKPIVRVQADICPLDPHQWGCAGSSDALARVRDTTIIRGWHYHYVVTSAIHWKEKYGKFHADPDVWGNGTAMPFPRVAWKHAAVEMKLEEAERYFADWVCLAEPALGCALKDGIIEKDPKPGRLIARAISRRLEGFQ